MSVQDYFAMEEPLVKRLQSAFPTLEINTPFNIEDMLQASNAEQSISVVYYGDRVSDTSTSGKVTAVYQQWLIVLCVREAQSQLQQTNELRKMANPLILKLLESLQGFEPNVQGYRVFKRTDSPVRQGSQSSFAYFPFLFEIQMFI